jgi:hypothetical protein
MVVADDRLQLTRESAYAWHRKTQHCNIVIELFGNTPELAYCPIQTPISTHMAAALANDNMP